MHHMDCFLATRRISWGKLTSAPALQMALDLFEAEDWSGLVGKVSTCCLPEGDTEAESSREDALKKAAESEELEPCPGKRVSLKGVEFHLDDAVAWTVRSPTGEGRAVMASHA